MISNHYPMTYQHDNAWLVLMAIGVVSAWIRHYFNLKHIGISRPSILVTGSIGMMVIAGMVSMPVTSQVDRTMTVNAAVSTVELNVQQQAVFDVVQTHCANCHAAQPTSEMFVVAPLGLMFDTWPQIEQRASVIYSQTVVTRAMPLMNKTAITEDERQVIGTWFEGLSSK
jgi:uncharacterized membrane protein